MIKRSLWHALVLAVGVWAGPVQAAAEPDPCRSPEEVAGTVTALPAVAKVLKPSSTIRVLAVGSATMFGPDATLTPGTLTSQALDHNTAPKATAPVPLTQGATEGAFPLQMAKALQTSVPGMQVEVVVRGGRGMTGADMLVLLRQELDRGQFQLVLWQTGTVEAVRNSPPGEFAQVLLDGAESVEAKGANLVLIDPQYSRFLQANSNLDPYAQALQQTAALPGVMLFHRFELMRNWANAGQIDLERAPRGERKKAVETLHRCIGAALARMVLAGARSS